MVEDERKCLDVVIYPTDASNKAVMWCSSNPSVVSVGLYTGEVWATSPGTATITATTLDGRFTASCDIWVRGKTPVFLLHGRASNSFIAWGAGNRIFVDLSDLRNKNNNHYNSDVNALCEGSPRYLYTNKTAQDIMGYESGLPMIVDDVEVQNFVVPDIFNGQFKNYYLQNVLEDILGVTVKYHTEHPEGGNLACRLWQEGYKANVNLFVFNYPNRDAMVHSAKKFEAYIDNLIDFVRSNGDDEMKCCFYDSKEDYEANNYKINLVGHSMGGLVCRYYIENLHHDQQVDKLITICTPHWGSGYGDASLHEIPLVHVLCDHDLHRNSSMYGGSNPCELDVSDEINLCPEHCTTSSYTLTDELQYQKSRNTKYYAIAGVDYDTVYQNSPNINFELPSNITTVQQLRSFFAERGLYDDLNMPQGVNPYNVGDNMVGLLSQIGWTETEPFKRIQMERVFINFDTVFEWTPEVPLLEVVDMFHTAMPHRNCVMNKVYEYLQE
jgi:hypothetical protein